VSENAIETRDLTKFYGMRPAVRHLNLRVRRGEVYALVGPNGAGKTTVIRLVAGLAFPTAGAVRMLGVDPLQRPRIRRQLGAVVEAPAAFYPYLSARENLRLHAKLAGGVKGARIGEVLEMVELAPFAEKRVGIFSLGMRQRLGVAAAMLTRPQVLVLDEPASGMDPLSLHLVHRILREAAEGGTAVLLSTHHLEEVVTYCSRVGILDEGLLIDEIGLIERRDRYRARVSDARRARFALDVQPFVKESRSEGQDVLFILSERGALGRVAQVLGDIGIELYSLQQDLFDLRSYYRDRVRTGSLKLPPGSGLVG
jgi:ABC-2 type transport system ATP-binding protein